MFKKLKDDFDFFNLRFNFENNLELKNIFLILEMWILKVKIFEVLSGQY
ncbi:MAG: hypothetical protein PHH83_04760 [Patescibacteria group bacterium]|nr:hypothetical protein [Patescibacteria group bacterium]